MSTRVWVLGDAVVDLLPESQGDYYSVLAGRLLMLQSVSQGWGGKVPLLAKLAMILSVALCIRH